MNKDNFTSLFQSRFNYVDLLLLLFFLIAINTMLTKVVRMDIHPFFSLSILFDINFAAPGFFD